MAASPIQTNRWWKLEGHELANQVSAICTTLEHADGVRRTRYTSALRHYEGRAVLLDEASYYCNIDVVYESPIYNVSRSACDTAKADIAGRQKPKPIFVTTGSDWKARRKAKKCDKFVEGQMSQRQGRYANCWELMTEVFHDSAKLGNGLAKVTADVNRKKVLVERVFPWEVFVDPREARYGAPQNLFHRYSMETDIVLETFVEFDDNGDPVDTPENMEIYRGILSAQKPRSDSTKIIEACYINEAWRLPLSEDSPGRHVICVEGCILFEEEWDEPEFPFVMLSWEQDTVGFWSTGLIEAHQVQHVILNESAMALARRMQICSTRRVYYDPDAIEPTHLTVGGESEVHIPLKDLARKPIEEPTQPASVQEFEWVGINIDRYFQFSGVSQQSASATKSKGLTAAVAIEAENDLGSQRFMPKARAYEEAFATLGRLMIRATKRVAKANRGFLVKWPGKRFLMELDWKDVSLEDDMYEIRIATISALWRDPAAQLQVAQDLHQGGIINRETFLQMAQLPDLEGLMNRETAEREFLEELFDRYLDSMDDEELQEAGGYEAPEPFIINKPAAMWLAVSTYWEARRDKAPLYCLGLLERWIQQLDKLIAPAPQQMGSPEAPGMIAQPGAAMPTAPGAQPGAPLAA